MQGTLEATEKEDTSKSYVLPQVSFPAQHKHHHLQEAFLDSTTHTLFTPWASSVSTCLICIPTPVRIAYKSLLLDHPGPQSPPL